MSATLTTRTRFIALFHCDDFSLPVSTGDNFCSKKMNLLEARRFFRILKVNV